LDAGEFAEPPVTLSGQREWAPENLEAKIEDFSSVTCRQSACATPENAGQSAIVRWPKDAQLQHWLGLVYFKEGQNAKRP